MFLALAPDIDDMPEHRFGKLIDEMSWGIDEPPETARYSQGLSGMQSGRARDNHERSQERCQEQPGTARSSQ